MRADGYEALQAALAQYSEDELEAFLASLSKPRSNPPAKPQKAPEPLPPARSKPVLNWSVQWV